MEKLDRINDEDFKTFLQLKNNYIYGKDQAEKADLYFMLAKKDFEIVLLKLHIKYELNKEQYIDENTGEIKTKIGNEMKEGDR